MQSGSSISTATSQRRSRICNECGREFALAPRSRRQCCSDECLVYRTKRQLKDAYQKRRASSPEKIREQQARNSHAAYLRKKSDPEAIAAQRRQTADWRRANPDKTSAQYREWRIANAARVAEKNRRRRARLLDSWVEDVDIEILWIRDQGTCGICCEPIDRSLPWPDAGSLTVDHVVPLARGGEHSYRNTQLAHAVCNSRKNDH